MVLLTLLNYRGASSSASFQDLLTWGLIALSLFFVSAGFVRGDAAHLTPWFAEGPGWRGALSVFMTTPFWFAGFNTIPQLMEEKAPGVPLEVVGRTLLLAIAAAGVFDCMVVLATSMTMPWPQLVRLDLPAASAFAAGLHSPLLAKTVLAAALLGLLTTWNAVFLCASRVLFSLSRARLLPRAFERIHGSYGSPSIAVVFTGVVASGLVLLGRGALLHLVNVAATCLASCFLMTSLAVVRLRSMSPEADRPYSVPGGRSTAVAAACGSLFMLLLSLQLPYRGAGGKIPIEWVLFASWAVAGVGFWILGRSIRESMTGAERRKRILGSQVPQVDDERVEVHGRGSGRRGHRPQLGIRFRPRGLHNSAVRPGPSARGRALAWLNGRGRTSSRPLSCHDRLAEALEGVEYVQESGPEKLASKKAIFGELDRLAPTDAILASSTSALDMSDIAEGLPRAGRTIVAHPVNPPHVIPVVEILPGKRTAIDVVARTRAFLSAVGQSPVLLNFYVPGFLLNRMQAALVREAIHLVECGAADVEAVDAVIRDGLGLRWALLGPFGVANTNADGGIREYFGRYGALVRGAHGRSRRDALLRSGADRKARTRDRRHDESASKRRPRMAGSPDSQDQGFETGGSRAAGRFP